MESRTRCGSGGNEYESGASNAERKATENREIKRERKSETCAANAWSKRIGEYRPVSTIS